MNTSPWSSPTSPPPTSTSTGAALVPKHWTPEQALAVAECLQAMRQALWAAYGPQMQQAWREQLMPDQGPPEFDPDEPF
jgi:hypothetical protein